MSMLSVQNAYLPIILAAAAQMLVGMAWYSEYLFGPAWKKLGGKCSDKKDMTHKFLYQAIASIVTATALCIAIVVFQKTQTGIYTKEGFSKLFSYFLEDSMKDTSLISAMKTATFIWLGFMAPHCASDTIWTSCNWTKFMIDCGGDLAGLLAMAAVIATVS